jgi:uncharacterized DUF497 family protein
VEFTEIIIPFEIEQKLIWKQAVHAYEVEEIFQLQPHFRFLKKGNFRGEDLYLALGQTESGRYLSVFFINKGRGAGLIISGREMDDKEGKLYAKISRK